MENISAQDFIGKGDFHVITPDDFLQGGGFEMGSQSPFNPNNENNQFVNPNTPSVKTGIGANLAKVTGFSKDSYAPIPNPLDIIKGAAEPALKGLASGARNIQATPSLLKGNTQKANEIMAKPLLGQKTLAGDSNLGNLGSAATAVSYLIGGKKVKSIMRTDEQKAAEATWNIIKPNIKTATEIEKAALKDGLKSTRFGGVSQVMPTVGKEADMIKVASPYLKGVKNELQAVKNMQKGIAEEAAKLRSGLEKSKAIWNSNELKGAINKIERPDLLSGDLEKSFNKTLNVVLKQAEKSNKNLSGLLDVRQAFDARVAEQYPNLYNSESMSAIKQAVTKTRNALNNLIENKLPAGMTVDGIGFRESLKKQSLLYDAIDYTAPKIKLGNPIVQWAKRNPKTSAAIGSGITTAASILGINKFINQ